MGRRARFASRGSTTTLRAALLQSLSLLRPRFCQVYSTRSPPVCALEQANFYTYVRNPVGWIDPWGLCETFYRTMSKEDYEEFVKTGKVPATSETFISPTQGFSENYDGVMVKFSMKPGTAGA